MKKAIDRAALESKRLKLQERLEAIKADLKRGLNRNSSEQAIELENSEVLSEIARVTQEELDTIDRQLQ